MEEYLELKHINDIKQIVNTFLTGDLPFRALSINLVELSKQNKPLFDAIMYRDHVFSAREKWTTALEKVQQKVIDDMANISMNPNRRVKEGFPVTFANHPRPGLTDRKNRFADMNKFIEIKAKVLLTHEAVKIENYRNFQCRKCRQNIAINAERIYNFSLKDPWKCVCTRGCAGTMKNTSTQQGNEDVKDEDLERYIAVQRIEVAISDQKSIWESLTVELDEELVDSCSVGDHVTILGVLEFRSDENEPLIADHVFRAVNLKVTTNLETFDKDDIFEVHCEVYDDWSQDMIRTKEDESLIRDEMIDAIAPELHGLAMIKLALMCVLCSGGDDTKDDENSENRKRTLMQPQMREIIHLLLIGHPGCGKSEILRAAKEVSLNAYSTVGYSTSASGLTASIRLENGRNLIEAGSLVKANNGILCIDEINLFPKEHRSSIHEALEHQTVTINKGATGVKLNAKCSIIASMNPKNCKQAIDTSNMSMEESLLSRFDLIFELEDLHEIETDMRVINHILSLYSVDRKRESQLEIKPYWSRTRLKKHIMIAKNIPVTLSEGASRVLFVYFWKKCKDNFQIEQCRRTMRLLTSLQRLTKCHAKLMLRREAVIHDALNAIMIMEQTWTFGHLMDRKDMSKSKIPLGMSNRQMSDLMAQLQLADLWDEYLSAKIIQTNTNPTQKSQRQTRKAQVPQQFSPIDIDKIMSPDESSFLSKTNNHNIEDDESDENVETVNTQLSTRSKVSSRASAASQPHFNTQQKLYANLANLNQVFAGDTVSQVENNSTPFTKNSPPRSPLVSQQIAKVDDTFKKPKSASVQSKLSIFQYESQSQKVEEVHTQTQYKSQSYKTQTQYEPSQSQDVKTQIPEAAKMDVDDVEFDLFSSFDDEVAAPTTEDRDIFEDGDDDDLMRTVEEVEQSQQTQFQTINPIDADEFDVLSPL